jgi:hypothetical protein
MRSNGYNQKKGHITNIVTRWRQYTATSLAREILVIGASIIATSQKIGKRKHVIKEKYFYAG